MLSFFSASCLLTKIFLLFRGDEEHQEVDAVHLEAVEDQEGEVQVALKEEKQSSLSLIVTTECLLLVERKTHLSHLTWCRDQKFTEKKEFLVR